MRTQIVSVIYNDTLKFPKNYHNVLLEITKILLLANSIEMAQLI